MPARETETPKPRAVAYIRESTEEQGQGFSPDAQREQIRRFAAENGLDLGEEYSDFHSGWRKADARPQFQRLMSDAAEQRFDVVLVYHTSRFARNQAESRRYKQLLRERLGIRVVSVTQPMGEDPTDPSAFLAESIHEMFDEYYSVSSVSFPGATCATPTPASPSPTRSGRRWSASCSSCTRPARSPTARWPPGSTPRAP
ncbi:MAG TPA: recombinase family protein [Solirubrobacterales bacterium]|nr:recombinase family protein [Solirubrobacterales bacterium]